MLVYPTIAAAVANARRTAVAPLGWDPTNHLLSRFSFGPTPGTRGYVDQNGPDAWYDQQVVLAAKFPGYAGSSAVAAAGPLLDLSPYDARQWLKDKGREYGWDAMDQLAKVTVGLQAWSSAQLYEVLVDFFSNHLNVPNWNGDVWVTRHAYDRDVIRANATGSFTTMLIASCKHPAMLTYLNLAESTKAAVNENYGRELLELHTVGLHYSENDVKAAAKLLTGRTMDDYRHYLFDDYIHFVGKQTVLGTEFANATAAGGEKTGDDLLRFLAAHPFTAANLARKLCVRFVSDAPSADLVAAVAKAYLDNKTQIMPMISTILRSTEFWESRGRKVRRPAENLIATVRAFPLGVTDMNGALGALQWASSAMGHMALAWPAPNGYPDVAAAWRSSGSLIKLWSYHLWLSGGWKNAFDTPDLKAMWSGASTSGQAVKALAERLTGATWAADDLAALQTFVKESAGTSISRSKMQWYSAPVAALILDSPYHALR